MSCKVEHNVEPEKSASSQSPEASDCHRDGSGDPPKDDEKNTGEVERTPFHDTSSSSRNATEGASRAKGKRRASELQGSMSGDSGSGSISVENNLRRRLTLEQKLEVLKLLNAGTTKAEVAQRYACSQLTVWRIAREKGKLELKMKSPGFNGRAKAEMPAGFPQLEDKVLKMVEDARRHHVPVTREVIISFGRVVKTQMLSSNEISDVQRRRLNSFCASGNWVRNFAKRQGLVSKGIHGEAGGVDLEAAKEGMEAVREAARHLALDNIFNVDDTGSFFKVLPRRTYVASFEGQKAVGETKDDEAADERLNLEAQKGASKAVECDGQEEGVSQNIESNTGDTTDDEFVNSNEEPVTKRKTPQPLSVLLDAIDEHPLIVGSPKAQDLLRRVRELLPDSVEGGVTLPGDTGVQ